ncbi:hypothetical protein A2Y85_01420 [candidate division WOR-3 bacterium RBG_13_43_14]|uniref:Type II secretion system protein GspE N-terminal domain-containing protein n=1 Tax=candidate division WOR-3 bacterium RBG_13_43_14 TaxID=1802590 RepID=A0A1F4U6J4_UNCW3|nr:MAG: hypothetical protein A2Y85_01420 [candidate division WOR-3 bacterium RBG_13_43_14]
MKIGELLIKNGIITEEQLNEALALQKDQNKKLGEILIDLGYISLKDLVWMISEQADIPFVEIKPEMLDVKLINSFPEIILQKNSILPIYETDQTIYIAVADPTDQNSINALRSYTDKQIIASGAEAGEIHQMLDKFYLSQHTDKVLTAKAPNKNIIQITSDQATVKTTDESGKAKVSKAKINIIINLSNDQGGKHNE